MSSRAALRRLDAEPLKVRRIPVDEANSNPDVFAQRVEERIQELLVKYGCEFRTDVVLDGDGAPVGATVRVARVA